MNEKVKPTVGIVYYTSNQLNMKIARKCREYIAASGLSITSVSLKRLNFGNNIHMQLERGKLTMFKQILAGIEASKEDIIFLCEDDVVYHKSHFDFVPERNDIFYYNENSWRVRNSDGHAVYFDHDATSQLCAYRDILIDEYRKRVEKVEKEGFHGNGYEPGTRSIARGGFSDRTSARWRSAFPNIDIRHDNNLTPSRWSPEQFRDKSTCQNWKESTINQIPGWETFDLFGPVKKIDPAVDQEATKLINETNMELQTAESPIIEETFATEPKNIDFPEAIRQIILGKKVTRIEWTNKSEYGFLNGKYLSLHKADGKDYQWIVNDGDINGTDWVIID